MVQAGNGARLAFKAMAQLLARRYARSQHFHRDHASKPRVLGFIDLAHASRADGREDLIRSQPSPRGECHVK